MLHKKYTIQKTFRLDSRINDDFEALCEILERTQNDLANTAIEDLLEENRIWLAQNILVEYATNFITNCENVDFQVENIHVCIKYLNEEDIELNIIQEDEQGNIIQEVKESYNEEKDPEYMEKIIKTLRYFGSLIDFNSKTIQEHLRLNKNYK